MISFCRKAVPQDELTDRKPWPTMISDLGDLKGDEVLLCHLPPRDWFYRSANGELIGVYLPHILGGFRRASAKQVACLMTRYESRAKLKEGDLVSATLYVIKEQKKASPVVYQSVQEACRFEAFADDRQHFAWVVRADGSRLKTGDFEAYIFEDFEQLWTMINGSWTMVCYTGRANEEEIEACVYVGDLPNGELKSVTLKTSAVRSMEEAVVPPMGTLVRALIGEWWHENCRFVDGSLGDFTVRTRFLKRRVQARCVQPMEYAYRAEAA